MNITDSESAYGSHSPGIATLPLRMITRSGLAHGKITRLLHKAWLRTHGPIVDAEIRGVRYRLNLQDNNTDVKLLISSKFYDQAEIIALAKHCQNLPFIDVGANTGYYSVQMAVRGCPKVISVEPNPPTLARLRYNISLNDITDRVKVIAAGVGPEGELEFYQTACLGVASFVKPSDDVPVIKVPTKPLLDILAENGIDRVGGMKIDVEGFEDQALSPFIKDAPDSLLPSCVVIEVCHKQNWKSDLIEGFLMRGYRLADQTRSNHILIR
jgi:FkbM family methyltransferase